MTTYFPRFYVLVFLYLSNGVTHTCHGGMTQTTTIDVSHTIFQPYDKYFLNFL